MTDWNINLSTMIIFEFIEIIITINCEYLCCTNAEDVKRHGSHHCYSYCVHIFYCENISIKTFAQYCV